MKKLSANSKLGKKYFEAYCNSNCFALEDAYVKPSAAKQAAFKRCQQKCEAEKGKYLSIISASPWFFTVAFEAENSFGATVLRIITKYHDYVIPLLDKLWE